ncbi:MAG: HD domain-containing protein [Bacteroidales bacterium]|nr:HD domain-containing protein [Bacteroidales bacterium]
MDDGTERVAYEWWRYDEVPLALRQWVETEVLPQYDHFDSAHRRDHARRVIARAMAMGNGQCAAPLCYAAAAMHDLGLSFGRDNHHLESGRIVRSCSRLQEWFTEAEVEMIAQAVEDHRASATNPPRSLLGCIVAEADRDVEPETIVRRTVEYGMSHYPELDIEGHWQRTLQHLDEKYSEHGYIKLWLADSPNAEPLAELRELIMDEARLRKLFLEIIK